MPGRRCDDQLAMLHKELVRRQQQAPIGLARQRLERALDLGGAADRSHDRRYAQSRCGAVKRTSVASEAGMVPLFKLANQGVDTRSLQHYLGHKNIQHTVRYSELSPDRFRDFWKD
jgi:hypothetical protein